MSRVSGFFAVLHTSWTWNVFCFGYYLIIRNRALQPLLPPKLDLKIKEALELLNKIIEDKEKSIKVSQSCFGTWIPNDLSMTGRVAGTVHSYKKELAKIKKILV